MELEISSFFQEFGEIFRVCKDWSNTGRTGVTTIFDPNDSLPPPPQIKFCWGYFTSQQNFTCDKLPSEKFTPVSNVTSEILPGEV